MFRVSPNGVLPHSAPHGDLNPFKVIPSRCPLQGHGTPRGSPSYDAPHHGNPVMVNLLIMTLF